MKIAIAGTHGVGKTTTVNEVYNQVSKKKKIFKINETYREVIQMQKEYQVEQKGLEQVQDEYWTTLSFNIHINQFNVYKKLCKDNNTECNIISDRSFFDSFVYYSCYCKKDGNKYSETFHSFLMTAKTACREFDYIFLIEPSDRLIEDDGIRCLNKQNQKNLHKRFIKLMATKDGMKKHNLDNVIIVKQENQQETIERIVNLYNASV